MAEARLPSPHRGRGWPASAGRVRGRGFKLRLDRRPNTVEILEDVVVPETDRSESLAFEVGRPASILLRRVLAAVDFDDELPVRAQKIHDVAVDLNLPAELEATELTTSKDTPELPFCVGRVLAQGSRPAGQEMVPCHYAPSPRSCGPTLSRVGERVSTEHAQIHA